MASLAATPEAISGFQAFTGASTQEASMFLEMAGGNVEMAVGLFFGGGGGFGFGDDTGASTSTSTTTSSTHPDWYTTLWGTTSPSEAWTQQALTFDPDAANDRPFSFFGLTQSKNGPCGVLAVLNALVIKTAMEDKAVPFGPTAHPTTALLATAITHLLSAPYRNDASSGTLQAGLWDNDGASNSDQVSFQTFETVSALEQCVLSNMDHYTRPGGLLLICYSVIQSRGVAAVQKDVAISGGECPLIVGPFTLCSSELMSLLMRGTADGNVGAYGPVGGSKIDWPSHTPVGLLSYNEVDHSIPVCDRLKSPEAPIWILHGRDHFTFMFQVAQQIKQIKQVVTGKGEGEGEGEGDGGEASGEKKNNDDDDDGESETLEMYHYNGLPPAGPRMTKVTLTMVSKKGTSNTVGPAPEDHKEGVGTFMTPLENTVFDVVQANQSDKKTRPDRWTTWRYEVVLHVKDDDKGTLYGKGEEYPEGKGGQVFSQDDGLDHEDGRWRCATCYVKRNETMAFRLNDAGSTVCQHCDMDKDTCGWSKWFTYDELTKGWQRSMNRQYQPKIKTLLGTKWINGTIVFDDDLFVNPPSI